MKRPALIVTALIVLTALALPIFANAQDYDCAAGQHHYTLFSHKPAAELTDGLDVFRCELCGQEYEAVLPATGHHWSVWTTDKEPACTVPGTRRRTCDAHSPHDETEEIPALGHDYKLTEQPPSCETDGVKAYVCSRCGDSYTMPGAPALGHEYIKTTAKQATCTENGVSVFTCSHDDSHVYTEEIPAAGHAYGDWAVQTPAKEGKTGVQARACRHCGAVARQTIPALAVSDPPPLFNGLDAALACFDAALIVAGVVALYPSLAAVHRVNVLWKQYLASKKTCG